MAKKKSTDTKESESTNNTVKKAVQQEITVGDFIDVTSGFTNRDRIVLAKMYGKDKKKATEWRTILGKKFNFAQK